MSRSRHTLPPRVYAERVGEFQVARVIERRPRPGDIHPIPKRSVEAVLRAVPAEYILGLRRVELRARVGPVGQPYGLYQPAERVVLLYSLPLDWDVHFISGFDRRTMQAQGAVVECTGTPWRVQWGDGSRVDRWFARYVLLHELGHHFERQYRRRRGETRGRRWDEETVAEITRVRLDRLLGRELRQPL
jgi:hypothetical protein